MFKVKYVDSIMMLVGLDLNLIVSLFQHKCEVSETVSTTTLPPGIIPTDVKWLLSHPTQNNMDSGRECLHSSDPLGVQVNSVSEMVSTTILTCICSYWNQTKFTIHKVWCLLREASQIGQTFIPVCEKVV